MSVLNPAATPFAAQPFRHLTLRHELPDFIDGAMAQFAVRIYREEDGGYRGTIDGIAVVRGRSLAETVRSARKVLGEILTGAFPDRWGIDPAGADLVVWFDIVLARRGAPSAVVSAPNSDSEVAPPQQECEYD